MVFGVKAELVARNNYTFTFTNAQPGSDVGFSAKVYPDASSTVEDGPMLVLDSSNAVSVWSDATILTAHTVDGTGNTLVATATVSSLSVTADSGTAGQSPFGGGGGGGGASEHLGDYGKWAHAGPTDGDSGSFDYAADLVDTSGTTISTDDSSEWIDNWGYPTAQVTESGTYSLFVGCSSSDAFSVAVYLLNAQGQGTSPTPFEDVANLGAVGAQVSGAGQYTASQSLTAYLPAGTHIDVSFNADGDPNPLSLLIQRVA